TWTAEPHFFLTFMFRFALLGAFGKNDGGPVSSAGVRVLALTCRREGGSAVVSRRVRLQVECLERRDAPAILMSATKLVYQDVDGDDVAVKFSKPILTAVNANTIFTFDTGAGAVNGSKAAKEQLQKIDLTGVAGAGGTTIMLNAVQSPL